MTASNGELQRRINALEARLIQLEGGVRTTYVGIAQDKSGSMFGREDATISGFNEYVQELKRKGENDRINYCLTLTQFSDTVTTVYRNRPLVEVPALTREDYRLGGMTALYDAVGHTVKMIAGSMREGDSALILIMTDGAENSSREYTNEQIKRLIKDKEATDRWTFVYLGADQDAWMAGTTLGFRGGNTFSYTNSNEDIHRTYSGLAQATHLHSVSGGATMDSFSSNIEPWIPATAIPEPQGDDDDK